MRTAPLLGLAAVVAVAACGDGSATSAPAASDGAAAPLTVIAGFYPLAFAVERVGGDLVEVSNLTPTGVEPHDLELSARDTATIHDADLVVLLGGFTPALDDAVVAAGNDRVLDVGHKARLDDHDDGDDGDDGDDHDGEHDGHAHAGGDPHFWLDPMRLADVADAIAAELGERAPGHAATFGANARRLRSDLAALDAEFTTALGDCVTHDLVTGHAAFGYLADRYGFEQVSIAGVTPDQEPSPATMADVTDFVRAHEITTIYTETLVDPAIAATIAAETGATTAVLDPLEGLTAESAGTDYLTVMRTNLDTLVAGQSCD